MDFSCPLLLWCFPPELPVHTPLVTMKTNIFPFSCEVDQICTQASRHLFWLFSCYFLLVFSSAHFSSSELLISLFFSPFSSLARALCSPFTCNYPFAFTSAWDSVWTIPRLPFGLCCWFLAPVFQCLLLSCTVTSLIDVVVGSLRYVSSFWGLLRC